MKNKSLWIIGCPSYFGGADTELWDTMQLWRNAGIFLKLTPTWSVKDEWKEKLEEIGVEIVIAGDRDGLDGIGLDGATVVSYCNGEFLKNADVFRKHECKVIWVGCMCWLFENEKRHYDQYGSFDAYVFQSEHQKNTLLPQLSQFGVTPQKSHVIHGPFNPESFPYSPLKHGKNEWFYIGKLSRDDPAKFSSNLWPIYAKVPFANRRARVMGWTDRIQDKLGFPPPWAEVLKPCQETAQEFIGSLHAMVPINGGAMENWPRVGLEAMSAGVPIVTQNQWGWREMIEHGETGFLCDTDEEIEYYTAKLAYEEGLRMDIAQKARGRLLGELANQDTIQKQWLTLLEKL